MNRQEALSLFNTYVQSPQLKKHTLAVEAGMLGYARILGEDPEKWSVTALLHDLDYEKHPEDHPKVAVKVLTEIGLEKEVIDAVKAHGDHMKTPRETPLAKALYACDELASFIVACALVRPSQSFEDLKWKSVKKKISDKAFAKGVNRENLKAGAEELGLTMEDHAGNMIEFLKLRERELQKSGESLIH